MFNHDFIELFIGFRHQNYSFYFDSPNYLYEKNFTQFYIIAPFSPILCIIFAVWFKKHNFQTSYFNKPFYEKYTSTR